jgi:hypothetical protein
MIQHTNPQETAALPVLSSALINMSAIQGGRVGNRGQGVLTRKIYVFSCFASIHLNRSTFERAI